MEPIIKPLIWKNKCLSILDQTRLPLEKKYIKLSTIEEVCEAIKSLRVRGAPLIGICAAYGMVVGALEKRQDIERKGVEALRKIGEYLKSSRPTAVNLSWAVEKILNRAEKIYDGNFENLINEIERVALDIHNDDLEMGRKIGEYGNNLIKDGDVLLTHCNAGGLATSGFGTALSPMFFAKKKGKKIKVFVDETRPLLQGARLTAYELMEAGIETLLITDSMSAYVMKMKGIDLVIVGADRIAANGDTANKIGTLGVALHCKHYSIPFYVAAPSSTFDFSIKDGSKIPIEERDADEIRMMRGIRIAPEKVKVFNPAFDVTEANLIRAFITEKGIIYPPYEETLKILQ